MMDIQARVNEIISGSFCHVEHITKTYELRGKVFCRISIGSDGMGPEVTVRFHETHFDEKATDVSIELWLDVKNEAFVLIYMSLVPKTSEMEHESVDIKDMSEAFPFFEKAISLFNLPKIDTE